ncbi:hypothetical protein LCGC14_1416210 [marine sediment metagenome]|uniref:Uncharacterized protein n=1 Tax=marine sediment metagenome TaxID=412755 RepID=A0A0F9MUH0_9ZZZZ
MAAMVNERFDSRVGSTVGIDGVSLPRLFRVLMDDATDDPIRILQNHAEGVPYQAAHPKNFFAVASNYTIVEWQTPKAYLVEVDYKILTSLERGIGIIPGWSARFRGYAESQPVLQEVLDFRETRPPRRIGTPKYRVATAREIESATHFYFDPVRQRNVMLVETGATVQFDLYRSRAAATMVLTKDKAGYLPSTFGEAVTFIGKTNYSTFFGAEPGHIEFVDIDVDPRGAEISQFSSSRIGGTAGAFPYGITLTFVWSFLDRALLDLVHVFNDEDGDPHIVIGPGFPDITSNTRASTVLQIAQTAEMRALLALFA